MFAVSDEVLTKAKKVLKARTKQWDDCDAFGFDFDIDKNEVVHFAGPTVCHYWVTRSFHWFGSLAGVTDGIYPGYVYHHRMDRVYLNFIIGNCYTPRRSNVSKEATQALVSWIASDKSMPFAKHILNKDDPDSLLNDGVLILCGPDGATEAEALWICKALRMVREGRQMVSVWHFLKNGGVDPLLSFLVASYIQPYGYEAQEFRYSPVGAHGNIFQFDRGCDPVAVYKREVNHKLINNRRVIANTSQVFSFDPPPATVSDYDDDLRALAAPVPVSDGWGGTTVGTCVKKADFLKKVKEWEKKIASISKGTNK